MASHTLNNFGAMINIFPRPPVGPLLCIISLYIVEEYPLDNNVMLIAPAVISRAQLIAELVMVSVENRENLNTEGY